MMQSGPQVSLTRAQAQRLFQHCTQYRRALVQWEIPSPARNQAIRAAQAVQARLCQSTEELALHQSEVHTLQQIVLRLLRQQRTTPPCEQRTALVAELAETLVVLHRGRAAQTRSAEP